MKFKLLIVGIFLIAMLTMGVVSASDFDQNDEIAAFSDNISSVESSSNILGENSYYDEDFYIYVQENYNYGKWEWDTAGLIYINSYCQRNGTFTISVDDVDKLEVPLTDGHFSVEEDENGTYNIYYKSICPDDLALDYGEYDIKVKFEENTLTDTKVALNEKEDFDIYLSNPYYCEEEYWSMPSFIIIDSNSMKNGTLEVFVNGTRRMNYAVLNGCFDEIADCSNRSRYLSPSDLLDGYGSYNIKVTFTENGFADVLKDENVLVAEFEPTVDPKLELGFYSYIQYLRADNVAYIYLPREAKGNLTISYNNHVFNVEYYKGYATHMVYAWNVQYLGETTFTATYVGDDFGTLTATETIVVAPTVNAPAYVSQGEEFSFSMITHEWVYGGRFDVYDYAGDVKGNLITSGVIDAGFSSVKLSSNKTGLNKYYLEFDTGGSGKYHSIQEVPVVKNSENITVDIPTDVQEGQDFNVTVNAPASPFTFAYISVDGGDAQYYSMENGTVSETLHGLSLGSHTVSVQYNNGYYEDGCWAGDVYSNTFTVTVHPVKINTNLTAADVVTTYNSGKNMVVTLKDENGEAIGDADLTVNLNNVDYTLKTDSTGQASLAIPSNLAPKTYVAAISYAGNEIYESTSTTANIVVNKAGTVISAPDVSVAYKDPNGELVATVINEHGKPLVVNLNINFNGEDYAVRTDSNGQASMAIGTLKPGTYTATITYKGSGNYKASTATARVTVTKAGTVISAPNVDVAYKDPNGELVATITNEHGKPLVVNLNVNFNGKDYTVKTDSDGQASVSIGTLSPGTYTATISYKGSSNYKDSTATAKVTVTKAGTVISVPDVNVAYKDPNGVLVATITNEHGKPLVVTLNINLNGKDYAVKTDSNGQVSIPIDTLSPGMYTATISYKGSSNYKASTAAAKVTVTKAGTVISAPKVNVAYKDPNGVLVATITNEHGKPLVVNLNVELNGKTYTVKTDSDGQASLAIGTLSPGTYTATISYKGSSNYKASTAKVKVTVTKADTVISAPKVNVAYKDPNGVLVATITNEHGKPLVVTLNVNLNGKDYSVKTDSNGQASIPIDTLKPGTYTATISYKGSSNYNAATTTTKVTVTKAATIISAPDVSVKYKDSNGKLVSTITNEHGKPLVVNLNVELNGKTYAVKTDSNGQASVSTADLAPGTYTATISYKGSGNYKATSTTAKITVKK